MESKDILAGIPSYNDQDTISFVVRQLDLGLQEHFGDKSALIVDCDGGSSDSTRESFLETETRTEKRFLTKQGVTGKGNVFRMLFELSSECGAKAIVVNDADLRSITPEWVDLQLRSVFEGNDFVTPSYCRYKYDATITNQICYPLIVGLFCQDIRQPIGGDFAFSGQMASYWSKQRWSPGAGLFGIDIFMTTNAILGSFKIKQANLGAKIHDPKDPSLTLGPMFRQVVSTLFDIICENRERLRGFTGIQPIERYGPEKDIKVQEFQVDRRAANVKFLEGWRKSKDMIQKCLPKEEFSQLEGMVKRKKAEIKAELWIRILYEYILAYEKSQDKDRVLSSLMPLWFGRNFTFINTTWDLSNEEAEDIILKQARLFNRERNYLLDRL